MGRLEPFHRLRHLFSCDRTALHRDRQTLPKLLKTRQPSGRWKSVLATESEAKHPGIFRAAGLLKPLETLMAPHLSADSAAAAPLCSRLEHAVTTLRRQLEQHHAQETRLQGLYHDWQSRWSEHCAGMAHHLSMLEAHLSTWAQHWQSPPRLTVVGAVDATEVACG
jgi:hypothetical protein